MTQKPILYIVILSALLILGIVLVWLPKYNDFNNVRTLVAEKGAQVQNKQEYFLRLENLMREFQERSLELAKVRSGIPLTPNVSDTFDFIAAKAVQSGLILRSANIGKMPLSLQQDGESEILKIPLEMSLSGSYSAFKNFLSNIQSSSRLIAVEEIFLKGGQEGLLNFDLRIRTHSY